MTIDDFESRIYEIRCHLKKNEKKIWWFHFFVVSLYQKHRGCQNSVNRKKEYKIKTIIS